MADVIREPGDSALQEAETDAAAERSAVAQQMLDMFGAAKPVAPDLPSSSVDVPRPQGLFTETLIGGVWPTESEATLRDVGDQLTRLGHEHNAAATSALAKTDEVFDAYWTDGSGAESAQEHYRTEYALHSRLSEAFQTTGAGFARLGDSVGRIKTKMRDAHDDAHREIEQKLRANTGEPVIFSEILPLYRTLIQQYSTELTGFVGDEVKTFVNTIQLPQSPSPAGKGDDGDGDRHSGAPRGDQSTQHDPDRHAQVPENRDSPIPTGPTADSREAGISGVNLVPAISRNSPTPTAGGRTKPSLPSLPSLPSAGGGSGSPLSSAGSGLGSLSGLLGNPGSSMASGLSQSASASNPGAFPQQASKALSSAFGENFGKGLAAGAQAASGFPSVPPQAPPGPLAAPPGPGSTPVSAAPAAAAGPLAASASSGSSGGTSTAAGGSAPASPMTSYGSVMPPAPAAAAGGGSAAPSLPPPSTSPASGLGGAGGAAAGFVPAVADPTPKRVSRDVSMSDLESARAALADLAAASSVGYPVLHWAVAVARGASGLPEMWAATNEGASYIPQDVFVPRAMVLPAGHDPAFDARWFGWTNPAETVLRAIQARGDVVSAIATTWPQDSDVVTDATPDVAVGVAPSGNPLEAQASNLTRNRSHRLETIEPALFHDLGRGDAAAVSAYLRQVIQQVSFDGGPELSGIAQSIAQSLISQRWPSADEWAGLRNEYDAQRLMASSQRPGLIGVEEPGQLLAYQAEYVHCRRLETLLCCEGGSTADIVYAAAAAGVLLASNTVTV